MQNTSSTPLLSALIKNTKGKFFSITFIKKNGEKRTINGKDFYRRLIKGTGESNVAAAGYDSFVNRNKEGWACAKSENVVFFKCGKIEVQAEM